MPTNFKGGRKIKTPAIPGKRDGRKETCEIRDLIPGGYLEIKIGSGESKGSVRSRVTSAAAYRSWEVVTRTDRKRPDILMVWRAPFVFEGETARS